MKKCYPLYLALFLSLSANALKAQAPNRPNILLLCIDDLRPELKRFGARHISSPHIDKLAKSGISFLNHYVNAPSCGPSRYTLLTGKYGPYNNYVLFKRAEKIAEGQSIDPSMPEWFKKYGYTTVSVGKVSHHPGGRGGDNWDDETKIEMPGAWDRHLMPSGKWQHPKGIMHGLAYGETRKNPGDMDVFQSSKGKDAAYPDGLTTAEGIRQLRGLAARKDMPFFLAIGILKPHLPFGAPRKYLNRYKGVATPPATHSKKPEGRTTWHKSGEFMKYNRWGKNPNEDPAFAEEVKRHYAACVSYADTQVGKVLEVLEETGASENTIVVLWGDHGFHLGEHAIWGKHSLFEESLHSPLIIHAPNTRPAGQKTSIIVETTDIFPTLCELSDIPTPGFAQGSSLVPIMEGKDIGERFAISYKSGARSIRTATHRMTQHEDGFVELYDHRTPEGESKNVASDNPDIVAALRKMAMEKHKVDF